MMIRGCEICFLIILTMPTAVGWLRADANKATMYNGGEYEIRVLTNPATATVAEDRFCVFASPPVSGLSNYSFEIDMIHLRGTNCSYGVYFNFVNFNEPYYVFRVFPADRKFQLMKRSVNLYSPFDIDVADSDYVNNSANKIKVTQNGARIKVYLNNQMVVDRNIEDYRSQSGVGVIVSPEPGSDLPCVFHFDNAQVWAKSGNLHTEAAVVKGEVITIPTAG